MEMEQWLNSLDTRDKLVRAMAAAYPPWLYATFGRQVEITFGVRHRLYIKIHDDMAIYHMAIYCVFNPTGGVYVQLHKPADEDLRLLQRKLSDPTSIKTTIKLKKGLGYAFRINTDGDYDVLKTITRRLVER